MGEGAVGGTRVIQTHRQPQNVGGPGKPNPASQEKGTGLGVLDPEKQVPPPVENIDREDPDVKLDADRDGSGTSGVDEGGAKPNKKKNEADSDGDGSGSGGGRSKKGSTQDEISFSSFGTTAEKRAELLSEIISESSANLQRGAALSMSSAANQAITGQLNAASQSRSSAAELRTAGTHAIAFGVTSGALTIAAGAFQAVGANVGTKGQGTKSDVQALKKSNAANDAAASAAKSARKPGASVADEVGFDDIVSHVDDAAIPSSLSPSSSSTPGTGAPAVDNRIDASKLDPFSLSQGPVNKWTALSMSLGGAGHIFSSAGDGSSSMHKAAAADHDARASVRGAEATAAERDYDIQKIGAEQSRRLQDQLIEAEKELRQAEAKKLGAITGK